jgi:hypothetical protein
MTHPQTRRLAILAAVFATAIAARPLPALPQASPTPQERVAALKQSLAESQKAIRQYEWIETTIISLKGEEKARTQKRCYYGADGKLQKLPLADAAPPKPAPAPQSGGRRGGRLKEKVVENKKDDMKDYMERAAGLVQQYVPPKPEDIQRAKDAGKVQASTAGPGRARLEFADYLQPGDRLAVDVDAAANRLLGLTVATYLDKPEDAVTLAVQLGTLTDGTSYTAQTTLDAAAKNIRVVIQNAGHRPLPK